MVRTAWVVPAGTVEELLRLPHRDGPHMRPAQRSWVQAKGNAVSSKGGGWILFGKQAAIQPSCRTSALFEAVSQISMERKRERLGLG